MGNCCQNPIPHIGSIQEYPNDKQAMIIKQAYSQPQLVPISTSISIEQKVAQIHEKEIIVQTTQVVEQTQPTQVKNQVYQQLISLYNQVHHFYANHDIDSSMPIATQIKQITTQYCTNHHITPQSLEQQVQNYLIKKNQGMQTKLEQAHLFKNKIIQQVVREHSDIIHYQQEISAGEWQESYNKKGIKISTRRQDNSVGMLIELDLELPFEIFIAILTEIDLYPHFIPFNEISRNEKQYSRNCRIGYNLNNYPFLSKREVYFQGIAYSRLRTHNQVFLFTRSIQDKKELQEYLQFPVKMNEDYVQLIYKYFVVKYQPVRKGLGKLRMALNADMGLNFLPNFVLQFLAKDFAKQFVNSLLQIGKDFKGSKWQEHVKKNPAGFDFFKKEIDEYFKNKQ